MQNTSSIVADAQNNLSTLQINAQILHIKDVSSVVLTILSHIQSKTSASLEASQIQPIHQLISLSHLLLGKITEEIKAIYKTLKSTNEKIELSLQSIETAIKAVAAASSTWGHANSLLDHLQAALTDLRKDNNYVGEYLVRKLFTSLVYLNPTSSPEEIRKAIALEQEHLDILFFFPDQPGSDQEKYNAHFTLYLQLLAKQTGLTIKSQTLQEKLSEILNHLEACLSKESTLPAADEILIRRSVAFLRSRPEWFFYQDFFEAKSQLKHAKQKEEDKALQSQIELQSILLETNQATRFIALLDKKDLRALIERIDALLKSSPSNAIIALSARARICEFLAQHSDQPEDLIRQVLNTLSLAIKTGEAHKHLLNFPALQVLAVCRFFFSFYSCFYFKTEQEYQEGHAALLKASKDLWTDKETKQAIHLLNGCFSSLEKCPHPVPIKKENLINLFNFKWMLLGKIEQLHDYRNNLTEKQKISFPKENVESLKQWLNDESSLWKQCKIQFVPSFFHGNLKEMQEMIDIYYLFHNMHALQVINPHYGIPPVPLLEPHNGNPYSLLAGSHDKRYAGRFMVLTIKNHTRQDQEAGLPEGLKTEGTSNEQTTQNSVEQSQRTLSIDHEILAHLLMQSKDHRLIGSLLAKTEYKMLEDILIEAGIGRVNRNEHSKVNTADQQVIIPFSNLQWFCEIFDGMEACFKKLQGDLSYKTIIPHTMQYFLKLINSTKQIDYMLDSESPSNKREKEKAFELRHHLPTLMCCLDLNLIFYQKLEHCVPNPLDKDYSGLFRRAIECLSIDFAISDSNEEKICSITKRILLLQKRANQIEENCPDPIQLENLQVQLLFSNLLITTLSDDEKLQRYRTTLLSGVGKTGEEIRDHFFSPENDKGFDDLNTECAFIATQKALHLIETQEVEAGMALLESVLGKHKNQWKSFILGMHPDFIKLKKLRKGDYRKDLLHLKKSRNGNNKRHHSEFLKASDFTNPPSAANPSANEDNWPQPNQSHLKQEIQKEAKKILQRQLEKKEKKQAKIASNSAPTTTADTNANLSTSTVSTSAQKNEGNPAMRKEISKTPMEIFNRLWQENAPIDGSWEIRSFRNDIKMTRREALALIEALGGSYFPERGKGSHHVAHLPKYVDSLPTIEFNEKDVGGITSWEGEEDELIITLTKDKELKFYQIKQLRNILLKQGFNPDTVFST